MAVVYLLSLVSDTNAVYALTMTIVNYVKIESDMNTLSSKSLIQAMLQALLVLFLEKKHPTTHNSKRNQELIMALITTKDLTVTGDSSSEEEEVEEDSIEEVQDTVDLLEEVLDPSEALLANLEAVKTGKILPTTG